MQKQESFFAVEVPVLLSAWKTLTLTRPQKKTQDKKYTSSVRNKS